MDHAMQPPISITSTALCCALYVTPTLARAFGKLTVALFSSTILGRRACGKENEEMEQKVVEQRADQLLEEIRTRITSNTPYDMTRTPPCLSQPIRSCRICQRVTSALDSKIFCRRSRKRATVRSLSNPTPVKFSGRPPWMYHRRYPVGPRQLQDPPEPPPTPAQSSRPRFTAEQYFAISAAISNSTSDASLRRLARALQQDTSMPTKAPANLNPLLKQRNSLFNGDFISVPNTSRTFPPCSQRSTMCSSDWKDADDPPLCKHCRHPAVIATPLIPTVHKYLAGRGIALEDVVLLKFGIDGGAQIIQFMLQFLTNSDPFFQPTIAVTPATAKSFYKNSGASSTLIIAALPAAKEEPNNIDFVLSQLDIEALLKSLPNAKLCVCADLKMILLLYGQKSAGAAYACPYCLFSRWSRHDHTGKFRTITTITSENQAAAEFVSVGKKLKTGKFGSSAGTPIAAFLLSYKDPLEVAPLGELHTVLGVVPHINKEIIRLDADLDRRWLILAGVSSNSVHAESDFVGPECHRLLRSVQLLRNMAPEGVTATRLSSQSHLPPPPPPPNRTIQCHQCRHHNPSYGVAFFCAVTLLTLFQFCTNKLCLHLCCIPIGNRLFKSLLTLWSTFSSELH